jgi:hypothetical protein
MDGVGGWSPPLEGASVFVSNRLMRVGNKKGKP